MFIKQSLACYRSGTGDCSFYIGLVLDCVPLELRERMDRGQRCFDSFPRTWVDVKISCLQDNMITKLNRYNSKKGSGFNSNSHARQPVNAYGTAGAVAP